MSNELPKWVENLITDLRDSDHGVRKHAAIRLGMWGKKHDRIVSALQVLRRNDPDQAVRDAAVAALSQLGLSIEQDQVPYPVAPTDSRQSPPPAVSSHQFPSPPQAPMPSAPPNSPEYVFALEKRVMVLEIELNSLRQAFSASLSRTDLAIARLPNSALLSPKFLSRAFAVWGHYLVAQLLIAIPVYLLLALLLGASLFSTR